MRKVILYIATSLDGFIAREDGALDWLEPVDPEGEDYGYGDFIRGIDTVFMGRKTFEVTKSFGAWPYGGLRCLVFSHGSQRGSLPEGVVWTRDNPSALLARMKRESGRHIWLVGGAALVASCLDQVDELRLYVQPVLLGRGIRLFPAGRFDRLFRLEGVRAYDSGLVGLTYSRVE